MEYGAGLGSFTYPALQRFKEGGQRFFAIEINPSFVKHLREECPELSLHEGCVSRVAEFCQLEGVAAVDGVISGLPWAAFSEELQNKLLDPMVEIMAEGGRFVTFAYIHALMFPAAKRFRRKLESKFSEVRLTPIVWRNLPPALCYVAKK